MGNTPFKKPPMISGLPRVDKLWGYEEMIHNDEYCAKLLVYTKPGKASSLHYHEGKKETFIITSGKFTIELAVVDPKEEKPEALMCQSQVFEPGDSITLEPYIAHRVRCLEAGVIVECSTHDDPDDCVRLVPSEK
jgi:quercetin dioxygenase-like cupin family protein